MNSILTCFFLKKCKCYFSHIVENNIERSFLIYLLLDSTLSGSSTFMDVVKAVAKQGYAARESVAIKADQNSYSYVQLISSAWRISDLLCNGSLKTVS